MDIFLFLAKCFVVWEEPPHKKNSDKCKMMPKSTLDDEATKRKYEDASRPHRCGSEVPHGRSKGVSLDTGFLLGFSLSV